MQRKREAAAGARLASNADLHAPKRTVCPGWRQASIYFAAGYYGRVTQDGYRFGGRAAECGMAARSGALSQDAELLCDSGVQRFFGEDGLWTILR